MAPAVWGRRRTDPVRRSSVILLLGELLEPADLLFDPSALSTERAQHSIQRSVR